MFESSRAHHPPILKPVDPPSFAKFRIAFCTSVNLEVIQGQMEIRIRIRWTKPGETYRRQKQLIALSVATMLAPAALTAFTMAFWRVAADMRWTSAFVISSGLFSHWQVWLATAAILLLFASALNRYGRGGGETFF